MGGTLAAALLALVGILGGCARSAPLPAAPVATEAIPRATLQNLTYRDVHPAPIQLKAGSYTGPRNPGDIAPSTVILGEAVAYGDLNGDGMDDAAVVLTDAAASRAALIYLAAVVSGAAVENAATVQLGQDFRVDSLAIVDGQILVQGETVTDEGSSCCTVVSATGRTYALQDGALTLVKAYAPTD
jgi:hypothetical protein